MLPPSTVTTQPVVLGASAKPAMTYGTTASRSPNTSRQIASAFGWSTNARIASAEDRHLVADVVDENRLHGRVAAAMEHQSRVLPDQTRGVHAERNVLVDLRIVPIAFDRRLRVCVGPPALHVGLPRSDSDMGDGTALAVLSIEQLSIVPICAPHLERVTKMSRNRFSLSVASALGLALIAQPEPAQACGGPFCSASAPVNQAAERIIFSKNADQTVTAVVQIQYQGPSEEFAWVLPVPGIPEVDVSSDLAFTRLQQASNPQYTLTTVVEGRCKQVRDRRNSDSSMGVMVRKSSSP